MARPHDGGLERTRLMAMLLTSLGGVRAGQEAGGADRPCRVPENRRAGGVARACRVSLEGGASL